MVTTEEVKSVLTEDQFAYVSTVMSTDESGNIVDLSATLFGGDGIMSASEIVEHVTKIDVKKYI